MNVIVLVKQVPDPEAPASQFKIDQATNKVIPPPGIAPKISLYDEYAIEAGIQLKEKTGGKVTALCLGPASAKEQLKQALAMGCDEAILLDDAAFQDGDSYAIATALAAAIQKIGAFDLVIAGRQSADMANSLVPTMVAERLGVPSANPIRALEASNGSVKVQRLIEGGYEEIELPTPALVAVHDEINKPRYPNLKGIMAASRRQIPEWSPADLGLDPSQVGVAGSKTKLLKLYIPQRESQIELIEADTPEEAAAKLAQRLREKKII